MGSGSKYIFPRREMGSARNFGWVFIVFGLFTLAFMTFWANGFVGGFMKGFGPWGILAALPAIPGFLA
ncbi:MAG: hypothetical protein B7Z55_15785, partial [Planctomycetales bacterium 12-60-4]